MGRFRGPHQSREVSGRAVLHGSRWVKVLLPRDTKKLDPRFLYWFLVANPVPSAGYSRHYKFLKRLDVPLPPLDEQRRIVAILDKADALRQKRKRAIALLDHLTRSIFMEMFGDPARNTKHLPLIRLGDLGRWQSGGTPPRSQARYFGGMVPWFSSGDLNDIYATVSSERISDEALRDTSAKPIEPDSLLLGMYDTAALKASISTTACSCNQAVAFARLKDSLVDTLFVYFCVVIGRDVFRAQQRGVRQKNLNLSLIKDIQIPLPLRGAQSAFATRVKEILASREVATKALVLSENFFASLQHRAFSGQL